MSTRDQNVINMQLVLIPIIAKSLDISYEKLAYLFDKYDVYSYIDLCYEKYNSSGNQGIIDDIKEYIKLQGGSIKW